MNWANFVKGASIVDYADSHLADTRRAALQGGREAIEQAFRAFPAWRQYLACPPFENAMNVSDLLLRATFYGR
jgi:hypothetical protein